MNKTDSHDKLIFFKNWPVWLLIYETFVLYGTIITADIHIYFLAILILVSAMIGLKILQKYPNKENFIRQYIISLIIILFFYSPFFIKSIGGGALLTFSQSGYLFFLIWIFFLLLNLKTLYRKKQFVFWCIYILSIGFAAFLINQFYFTYPLSFIKYITNIGIALIMGLFFIFFGYLMLLIPFTLYLVFFPQHTNDKSVHLIKRHHKIFDTLYFIFLTILPILIVHIESVLDR